MEMGLWNTTVHALLIPIVLAFGYAFSEWFDRNCEILRNKIPVLGRYLKEPQIMANIPA